jgi:hypothetical protein
MIVDMQAAVVKSLLPDRLKPTCWKCTDEPGEQPTGHLVAMLTTPQELMDARRVSQTWRIEVESFLHAQVERVSKEIVLKSVEEGLELCNYHQYPDPSALPHESHFLFSVFLGKRQVFSIVFYRQALEGGTHELIVQCGVDDRSVTAGARFSPEHVVAVPAMCWIPVFNYTEEQLEEMQTWYEAQKVEIERWLTEQHTALRAAAPLVLFE